MTDDLTNRIGRLEGRMENMERTLHGEFGQGGLIRKVDEFLTKWSQREDDKMKYDDRQERKQDVLLIIMSLALALGTLIVGILGYEHVTHHSLLQSGDASNYTASQRATR